MHRHKEQLAVISDVQRHVVRVLRCHTRQPHLVLERVAYRPDQVSSDGLQIRLLVEQLEGIRCFVSKLKLYQLFVKVPRKLFSGLSNLRYR